VDTLTGAPCGSYFEVDGQPLGERKIWLNDDYVKFIRFAQWRIEKTGHGVLAFITNHGYLDNPTFRGMRQSLLRSFDDIYLLNLHGNSKKKERAPDGGKDENVFDIQQGVAIGIFVRRKREPGAARNATVHHADLWGEREQHKYPWLAGHGIADTEWISLRPESPLYMFVPRKLDAREEYVAGTKVNEALPIYCPGVITARDAFAVGFDDDELLTRIKDLRSLQLSDDDIRAKYFAGKGSDKYADGDTRGWKLPDVRHRVQSDALWDKHQADYLYRPFDLRRIYYVPWIVDWPRPEVMRHISAGQNLGLISTRQTRDDWDVLATREIIGHKSLAAYDINSLFPLYLYPDLSKPVLMHDAPLPDTPGHRRANLAPEFVREFAARLGMAWVPDGKGDRQRTFGPEDVFSYMYAVFHSPEYRERYAEFLKIDFPRLPLTDDPDLFRALCAVGDRLVALHLLEAKAAPLTRYPVPGDNRVERVRYTAPGEGAPVGRVWINNTQYIEGVPPEVWEFHIGGYQVCEKWLKDREGRVLTYDDLAHYHAVVAALAETRTLMEAIDEAIEEHGGWPLAGSAAPAATETGNAS
jgi:predicted helicase